MAINAGPKIVEDGLIFYLDAANPRSYDGAGTTWTDLTTDKANGTLVNMTSSNLIEENGGVFTFDGTNDYINVPAATKTNLRGSLTVTMFAKSNDSSSNGFNIYWSGVSKYEQFILGPYGENKKMAFLIYSGTWYPAGYGGNIWGQSNIDPREYHYYVGMYDKDSGLLSLYVDGNLEYSSNIGSRTLADDPNNFTICKRDVSGHYLNASIGLVQIYNRALSAEEVLKNYNATKWRFQ